MTLINKIATGLGAVTLAALSLTGCVEDYTNTTRTRSKIETTQQSKQEEVKDYFAEIPMHHAPLSTASVAMTSGDFNRDGNLDVVLSNLDDNGTMLYFFEGDGKGNFKLRQYSK